jgi:hypothetical protein|nr:MAG TPA: hypothetical protein [Caudoviricetes sp.]DAX49820.1 MAG TPA: hypothetical protein [Caudoviricetes sp.]
MFFKEISDLGIMVVICGVFLYFSKTIFDYMIKEITKNQKEILDKLDYAEQRRILLITGNEKLIDVLNRLESRLRTEKITGKALEVILNTKASQISLCIKNEAIDIINNNSINKNWDSIESEMDNLYDEKILKFQKDYQDLIEFEIYSEVNKNFGNELLQSKIEIISILSNLKNSKDVTDYRIAIRKVSASMDKTKKHMQKIINNLIN